MIYAFDDYELDTSLFELRREGQLVPLEPQVFDLLAFLIENHDRVVTKRELIDKIWPEHFISDSALNSRVMAARKAVGDSGREQRLIRTMHGRGYRFVGPARSVDSGDGPAQSAPAALPSSELPVKEAGRLEQQIRFCVTPDNVRIAYATTGSGLPLVKTANWLNHLEFDWRSPVWRHFVEELSRDHTFVRYDERGSGLSDWEFEDFSFEGWVRDLETVVDALGLEQFPLLGISQGGPVAITYAARHPERVSKLILLGAYPLGRGQRNPTPEEREERQAVITLAKFGWGRDDPTYRQLFASAFIPGGGPEEMRWFNDLCRVSASPANAVRFMETFDQIDVQYLLPEVKAPTLVIHARNEMRVPYELGRKLAAGIKGARLVTLESPNHILLENEPAWPQFLKEVRAFLGVPQRPDRTFSENVKTILFTDIEGSTTLTQKLGDERARELFREHERRVREALAAHGGSEIKTMGDGFMASFPSATRALECAIAVQRAAAEQSGQGGVVLRVRAGLNTGEPIAEEGDLFGTAVILAKRIADEAQGDQVLVSDIVRQLVAGRGFIFSDRGVSPLRGFEDPVRLFELRWRE
ncbi:MAG TPA: alpha/beta fold hydrolase [Dehalococcoidia bacterium]|nr:alpha/beta fold hydrolase [Dehalococcoidia bacterium]